MKIVMITGSPHRHGTSALLADAFIQGAQEAGHTVFRFDAAFQELHPCRACERCHNTDKGCIYKDGMEELNPHLLEADLVAFASPIYYYDWSAQLKLAIDRFYANSTALRRTDDFQRAVACDHRHVQRPLNLFQIRVKLSAYIPLMLHRNINHCLYYAHSFAVLLVSQLESAPPSEAVPQNGRLRHLLVFYHHLP